jgi:hypothetical protein
LKYRDGNFSPDFSTDGGIGTVYITAKSESSVEGTFQFIGYDFDVNSKNIANGTFKSDIK